MNNGFYVKGAYEQLSKRIKQNNKKKKRKDTNYSELILINEDMAVANDPHFKDVRKVQEDTYALVNERIDAKGPVYIKAHYNTDFASITMLNVFIGIGLFFGSIGFLVELPDIFRAESFVSEIKQFTTLGAWMLGGLVALIWGLKIAVRQRITAHLELAQVEIVFDRLNSQIHIPDSKGKLIPYAFDNIVIEAERRFGPRRSKYIVFHFICPEEKKPVVEVSQNADIAMCWWQSVIEFMDKDCPLPDIPILEQMRSIDAVTQAYDEKTQRPSHFWREIKREELEQLEKDPELLSDLQKDRVGRRTEAEIVQEVDKKPFSVDIFLYKNAPFLGAFLVFLMMFLVYGLTGIKNDLAEYNNAQQLLNAQRVMANVHSKRPEACGEFFSKCPHSTFGYYEFEVAGLPYVNSISSDENIIMTYGLEPTVEVLFLEMDPSINMTSNLVKPDAKLIPYLMEWFNGLLLLIGISLVAWFVLVLIFI